MGVWWKVFIGAALVLPMMAYVVGSLVASGADGPSDRDPVIIRDSRDHERDKDDKDDKDDLHDNGVRVVTPTPTRADGDDDDDGPEGDDDDSRRDGGGSDDDDGGDSGSGDD